jgi:hypothetical protein
MGAMIKERKKEKIWDLGRKKKDRR